MKKLQKTTGALFFLLIFCSATSAADKTIMVIMNNSNDTLTPDVNRFEECLAGRKTGKDIIDGKEIDLSDFSMEPKSILIAEIN